MLILRWAVLDTTEHDVAGLVCNANGVLGKGSWLTVREGRRGLDVIEVRVMSPSEDLMECFRVVADINVKFENLNFEEGDSEATSAPAHAIVVVLFFVPLAKTQDVEPSNDGHVASNDWHFG